MNDDPEIEQNVRRTVGIATLPRVPITFIVAVVLVLAWFAIR
jgi:hypothetical protein